MVSAAMHVPATRKPTPNPSSRSNSCDGRSSIVARSKVSRGVVVVVAAAAAETDALPCNPLQLPRSALPLPRRGDSRGGSSPPIIRRGDANVSGAFGGAPRPPAARAECRPCRPCRPFEDEELSKRPLDASALPPAEWPIDAEFSSSPSGTESVLSRRSVFRLGSEPRRPKRLALEPRGPSPTSELRPKTPEQRTPLLRAPLLRTLVLELGADERRLLRWLQAASSSPPPPPPGSCRPARPTTELPPAVSRRAVELARSCCCVPPRQRERRDRDLARGAVSASTSCAASRPERSAQSAASTPSARPARRRR